MPTTPMYIVSVADDNYAQHLGVMLCSLFENKKPTTNIELYIIDGGLSSENKEKIFSIVNFYKTKLVCLSVDRNLYTNCLVDKYISMAVYYRISIPDIIPKHIDKILYIDCDTIILNDLTKLWNTNMRNKVVGAIADLPETSSDRKKVLCIPESSDYFNSGVLLINVIKWKEFDVGWKVRSYLREYPERISFWDQDALNAILYDKFLVLSERYNVMIFLQSNRIPRTYRNLPVILHYIGQKKPWHLTHGGALSKYYFNYLEKTPWNNSLSLKDKKMMLTSFISDKISFLFIKHGFLRNYEVLFQLWRFSVYRDFTYSDIKYRFLNKHKTLFEFLRNIKKTLRSLLVRI